MVNRYESYLYVDLSALGEAHAGDPDGEPPTDARDNCAGKVLLMFNGRGVEVVRVPKVLN